MQLILRHTNDIYADDLKSAFIIISIKIVVHVFNNFVYYQNYKLFK